MSATPSEAFALKTPGFSRPEELWCTFELPSKHPFLYFVLLPRFSVPICFSPIQQCVYGELAPSLALGVKIDVSKLVHNQR